MLSSKRWNVRRWHGGDPPNKAAPDGDGWSSDAQSVVAAAREPRFGRRARMSQSVTQSLLLLAVAVASAPTPARAQASRQDELLATAKATLVSQVEPGLPATPFEAWLAPLVDPGASFSWELNDCGEHTDTPDPDQDRLICASVEAALPGGRSVYLYFEVGAESHGAVASRSLWFAAVLGGEKVLPFFTLAALATHLREEQR